MPLLQVGYRGIVQTDGGFRAKLLELHNFRSTCSKPTWDAMQHYARDLRSRKIKIAFFSSTPQGGGVALMRHALVRFSRLLGVDLTWYGKSIRTPSPDPVPECIPLTIIAVPKPRPGVFRITKNIHNILQGVADPDQRITDDEKALIVDWIHDNAKRYWLSHGGPLRPVNEGGADVVVVRHCNYSRDIMKRY